MFYKHLLKPISSTQQDDNKEEEEDEEEYDKEEEEEWVFCNNNSGTTTTNDDIVPPHVNPLLSFVPRQQPTTTTTTTFPTLHQPNITITQPRTPQHRNNFFIPIPSEAPEVGVVEVSLEPLATPPSNGTHHMNVVIRVRPKINIDDNDNNYKQCVYVDQKQKQKQNPSTTTTTTAKNTKCVRLVRDYSNDRVFPQFQTILNEQSTQQDVYLSTTKNAVDHTLQGINGKRIQKKTKHILSSQQFRHKS